LYYELKLDVFIGLPVQKKPGRDLKDMKKIIGITTCFILLCLVCMSCGPPTELIPGEPIKLIVRGDDMGSIHSCNLAIKKGFEEGILTCASLIVPSPWFEEAARMCAENPHWCIGVHLTLNSEWRGYRWKPLLPVTEVPSLVDEDGYFHPTEKAFLEAQPNLQEVEKELRAQMDLALKRNIDAKYIDTHMGTARATPELHAIVKKICQDYRLPLSQESGETRLSIYEVHHTKKEEMLAKELEQIGPGLWLLVIHPGLDTPETRALVDLSPDGLPSVAAHRAAVTRAITGNRIKKIIKQRNIQLVDYSELRDTLRSQKSPQ
jgi:predicted glycoside hydrolase/deacetylase ChbG (UPF0249 family)